MERRNVLIGLIGGLSGVVLFGLGALGAAFGISSSRWRDRKARWVALCREEEVTPGDPVAQSFSFRRLEGWYWQSVSRNVYVLRDSAGALKIFSRRCTHLGCPVKWSTKSSTFRCPCHGAVFARDGSVSEGPPPRPLDEIPYRVIDGIVEVEEA